MAKHFAKGKGIAEVRTDRGVIRGYEYGEAVIFKGIPYAKAHRFHRPEPVPVWEGVLDCTSYGYVCPIRTPGKPNGEVNIPHRYWVQNEDCQNLNLWTPALDGKKRPVMVWLHGGGFSDGSSIEQAAYDGYNMAVFGDAVVVSINHRLNILGYFDLSDFGPEYENSGNAGTDDIIAALRWIRANIAAFGGDPDNVCLFGQSGGGMKITALLQSPEADGLYHKGIVMSGVINGMGEAAGSGKPLAEEMMSELGIKSVKELEEVPYDRLQSAYQKVSPEIQRAGGYVGCAPHPNRYCVSLAEGFRAETKDIPLLVGTVLSEMTGFVTLPGFEGDTSDEESYLALAKLIGDDAAQKLAPLYRAAYPGHPLSELIKVDLLMRPATRAYIARRAALNQCTWAYFFDKHYPRMENSPAWHCADIPYVFHNADLVEYTQEEGMEELEAQIFAAVMAFARASDPNHALIPSWEPSTGETEKLLYLGDRCAVLPNNDHAFLDAAAPILFPIVMRMIMEQFEKLQH